MTERERGWVGGIRYKERGENWEEKMTAPLSKYICKKNKIDTMCVTYSNYGFKACYVC